MGECHQKCLHILNLTPSISKFLGVIVWVKQPVCCVCGPWASTPAEAVIKERRILLGYHESWLTMTFILINGPFILVSIRHFVPEYKWGVQLRETARCDAKERFYTCHISQFRCETSYVCRLTWLEIYIYRLIVDYLQTFILINGPFVPTFHASFSGSV